MVWRKCTVCNGYGHLIMMKTRVNISTALEHKRPLLNDENDICPFCKGKGEVCIRHNPFNPLGFFRKDKS